MSNDISQAARIVKASDGAFKVDVPRSAVATVQAADLDLVLVLKDGTKIVLANAAIEAMDAKPPSVTFADGKQVPSPDLLSEVGKVDKAKYSMQSVSSADAKQTAAGEADGKRKAAASDADAQRRGAESEAEKTGGAAAGERAGAPVPQAAPSQTEQQAAKAGKGAGSYEDPPSMPAPPPKDPSPFNAVPMKQGVAVQKPPADPAPPAPEAPPPPPPGPPTDRPTVSLPPKPILDMKLVNLVGSKTETLAGGGVRLQGSGGVAGSDTDVNPNVQSAAEQLRGTAFDDVIEGDSAAVADGFFAKVLTLSLLGASAASALTLTGLPSGFTVSNATLQADGSWTVSLGADTDLSNLNLTITYPVSDSAEASRFTLGVNVVLADIEGNTDTVSRNIDVLMQEVNSAADLLTIDPVTGDPVFVLPLRGLADEIRAGAGNDVVRGQAGSDRLYGEAGDDQLFGGVGDDLLVGGAGADILDGGTGNDTASWADATGSVRVDLATQTVAGTGSAGDSITSIERAIGGAFDDELRGDAGANRLEGGGGDDVIAGGGGADSLLGGAGLDTLDYSGSSARVLVSLESGTATGGDAQGDVVSGFENVIGSAFDDRLVGDAGTNRLEGRSGDDTLDGGVGADVLDGGAGVDTADYSASQLAVNVDARTGTGSGGDAEGDTLVSIENITGGAAGDVLAGDDSASVLNGGAGNDRLEGRGGDDTLVGGTGDDTLLGGAGTDTLLGGDGVDTARYDDATGAVQVFLDGTQGIDDIAEGDRLIGVENLVGGSFSDRLVGDAAANRIEGGTGNDTLAGGAGADFLDGGADTDTADYSASRAGVNVDLTRTGSQVGGDADGDTLARIENVKGSVYADVLRGDGAANRLEAGAGDDRLDGGAGDDVLLGGDGDDILVGGLGADQLFGNGGRNTVDYSDSAAGVSIDLTGATAARGGSAEGDTLSAIQDVIGSDHNDGFVSTSAGNLITGGAGTDVVSYAASTGAVTVDLNIAGLQTGGFAQNDQLSGIESLVGSGFGDTLSGDLYTNRLEGGDGDDLLVGRGGGDQLIGGQGSDTASYADASGGVSVSLASLTGSGGDAQGDVLESVENLVGSAFGDVLFGDGAANRLAGEGGDDRLRGGAGADMLEGGAGIDTVDYAGSNAAVVVDLASTGLQAGGHAAGDVLSSIENAIGSSNNDTLRGASGANVLEGGAGDDLLEGYEGADTLEGGDGIDTASYSSSSTSVQVDLALLGAQVSSGDASNDVLNDIENLTGSSHADRLSGTADANRLNGGAGNDVLDGRGGADTLIGGGGTDTVTYAGSSAGVTVDLNRADAQTSFGDASGDVLSAIANLTGSRQDDSLRGSDSVNVLDGGDGNDTLEGRGGADTLVGGAGNDTAIYTASAAGVTVRLDGVAGTGGDAQGDILSGIENVVGSGQNDRLFSSSSGNILDGAGGTDWVDYSLAAAAVRVDLASAAQAATGAGWATNDTLIGIENVEGSTFNDTLSGNGAANTLSGGSGDDRLEGRGGADAIIGGGGFDTATYVSSTLGVDVDLMVTGAQGGFGDAAGDVLSSIEHLTGSANDDTLRGDAQANRLEGGDGEDTLEGRGGADLLIGGSGTDTASYQGSAQGVTVDLDRSDAQFSAGDASGDILQSINNLSGSSQNDTLFGNSGVNTLLGESGNDILEGRGGADRIDGGMGVNDYASYASSALGVTVDLELTGWAEQVSAGDADGDMLSNIESLTGSGSADTLRGNDSANTLAGGNGDDLLEGRGGADTLAGGTGNDTASYASSSAGVSVDLTVTGAQAGGGDGTGDVLSGIEHLQGSAFDDTLRGGVDANRLYGADGNDVLEGRGGADLIDGGAGADTASYANSSAGVTVDLALVGTAQFNAGDAAGDILYGIEQLLGSAHDDTLRGNSYANRLTGGSGDDVLEGREGADVLDGGIDIDTASYAGSALGVTVDLQVVGAQFSVGDANGDTLSGIESLAGSGHDDTLRGSSAANVLSGADGDDELEGRAGADTIDGGAGFDTANYENSVDAVSVDLQLVGAQGGTGDAVGDVLTSIEGLTGSAGNDTLRGNADANRLYGGSGADLLEGRGGADSIEGGGGIDTASYASSQQGVTVDLDVYQQVGGDAAGDMLDSIENLTGSASADTLRGSDGVNLIAGGGGNDLIEGRGGADVLSGETGIDTVSYASSSAGVGVDLNNLAAQGGIGDEAGDVLSGFENVYGSGYDDRLRGNGDANRLEGGSGNDVLQGRGGADELIGGSGIDTAVYGEASTGVTVDLARTGLQVSSGVASGDVLSSIENLSGSAHDDTLRGDAGANQLVGGDGNDVLEGRASGDTLFGSEGFDTAAYTSSAQGVTVDLATTGAQGGAGDGAGDTLDSIEGLSGSLLDDMLSGDGAVNTLFGDAGNDVLQGRGGADTLQGGAGVDTASYEGSAAGVTVNLALATAQISAGDASDDILLSIENFRGSAFDDTILSSADANLIDGAGGRDTVSYANSTLAVNVDLDNAGVQISGGDAAGDTLRGIENLVGSGQSDTLRGTSGVNLILGGTGNDVVEGRDEADTLDGGDGVDTASYESSAVGVTIDLNFAGAQGGAGDGTGDVLTNFENLTGSASVDTLRGNASANVLVGGDGNDVLQGRGGGDTLIGGSGADTATYAGSSAGVTIDLDLSSAQGGAGDGVGDMLSGIESLSGSAQADTLRGTAGSNTLHGDAGDDIIEGRAGADTLDGGAGIDTASYGSSTSGVSVDLTTAGAQGGSGDATGDVLANMENLTGSSLGDTLRGNAGANVLLGGDGNDVLEGRGGADTLNGGAGIDTATYAGAGAAVTVNLNGTGSSGSDAAGDVLVDVENVIGSGYDDTFISSTVANGIEGGNGIDTVSYAGSALGVTVDLALSTAQAPSGNASGDVLSNIENLTGSGQADTLRGDAGANTILGGLGNDTIEGRAGSDMLDGGGGTDTASYAGSALGVTVDLTVTGSQGGAGDGTGDVLVNFENLTGSTANDALRGDGNANTLLGGDGDDVLEGRGGADTLDGGNGTDTVSYANSNAAVTVNLGQSTAQVSTGEASDDLLSNIENLTGSGYDDTIVSASGANAIDGGAGVDTVSYAGSGQAVTVDLTRSTDQISTGNASGDVLSNIENLIGSTQSDTLLGNAGVNAILGGTGNDVIEGRAGADALDGGDGSDTASYASSATGVTVSLLVAAPQGGAGDANGDVLTNFENLTGSAQADTLTGNAAVNTIVGGDGDDLLDGRDGGDTIDGGDGTDTVTYANSGAGVNVDLSASSPQAAGGHGAGDVLSNIENLTGSNQADTLRGGAGANTILGGLGNDTIEGRAGADMLDGGDGTDTLSYENAALGVTVDLALATTQGGPGDATGDVVANFENLTGSGSADTLWGTTGANVINGGGGDDVLRGRGGADTFDGGAGVDTVDYSWAGGGIGVSLTPGYWNILSTNTGAAAGDTIANVENVTGTSFNDTIVGTTGANTIIGGDGHDDLRGAGGADTIQGGLGNDIVLVALNTGGSYDGGAGTDTITWVDSATAVVASLTAGTATVGASSLLLANFENVVGSQGADSLTGDGAVNAISGGLGNDVIEGRGGADVLAGGDGIDTASYANSATGVTVDLTIVGAQGGAGDATGDVLTDFENLRGSAQADTLTGNDAVNMIVGGNGNDMLDGRDGGDTIDGELGSDTVTYANSGAGVTIDLNVLTAQGGAGHGLGDVLANVENLTGSGQADTLRGNVGVNTLLGGEGNDTIEGRDGADTLDGGDGTDTLSYASSTLGVTVLLSSNFTAAGDATGDLISNFENVIGSANNDSLAGDAGVNVLVGGSGDDTLDGMAGADTIDGGLGTDRVFYGNSDAGVTVNLSLGAGATQTSAGHASGDMLTSIESLTGSSFNDLITASSAGNMLDGGAGTDTISYVNSSLGVNVDLNVTTGQTSFGDAASDVLSNFENLTGSAQADTLRGTAGVNTILGGLGDDTIEGRGGADSLDGGDGIDTASYASSATGVTVSLLVAAPQGGAGDATGDVLTSFENLTGSAQADTLTGNDAVNTIVGGDGNDTLDGRDGGDTLDGGNGTDRVTYASSGAGVTIDLNVLTAQGGAGHGLGDVLSSIEDLTGSAFADTLSGSSAVNNIRGGDGDDVIEGRGGADTLNGGNGTDTVSYASSALGVMVDLNLATSQVGAGDGQGDVLTSFENLTGSAQADTLRGTTAANVLLGGGGNDTIEGRGGNDTIDGGNGTDTVTYENSAAEITVDLGRTQAQVGTGEALGNILLNIENLTATGFNDTIISSSGANTIDGRAGTDTISYVNSSLGVDVDLNVTVGQTSSGDASNDVLSNIENLTGSGQGDVLSGTSGVNVILGLGGNDTIEGRAGADDLDGGDGIDTASYASSATGVTVSLLVAAPQGGAGDGTGDVLTNFENLTGSAQADTLTGNDAVNTIVGGDGNDMLDGRDGGDTLDGGLGTDTVTYANSGAGVAIDLNVLTAQGGAGHGLGDVLSSIENLTGSSFADTLSGSSAVNVIVGGDGDDVIEGRAGADSLDGGTGTDTVSYASSSVGVRVDLWNAGLQGGTGDGVGDVLANFENMTGSSQADTLRGNTAANVLLGGGGNDTIEGRGGNDTIDGGDGTDTVTYENSAAAITVDLGRTLAQVGTGEALGNILVNIENLTATGLNDTIISSSGANTIDGRAGTDTISYVNSSLGVNVDLNVTVGQTSSGDASNDVLSNFENLTGSGQADTLRGNSVVNTILGGAGDDVIEGRGGADVLNGGDGTDTVSYQSSATGVSVSLALATPQGGAGDGTGDVLTNFENLTGSGLVDTLTGNDAVNTIVGGDGNDTLDGRNGGDTLDGGNGTDRVTYANSGAGVTIDLNVSTAQGGAGHGLGDVLSSIENLIGSSFADTLFGSSVGNQILGGDGDDLIEGRSGGDALNGGNGTDTVSYASSALGVMVDLNLGTSQGGTGDGTSDVLTSFENLTGSAQADTLRGTTAANVLLGGGGNDTIEGRGGNDTIDGGDGTDTVTYANSAAAITVDLGRTLAQVGTGEALGNILVNIENLTATGLNDTIISSSDANTIDGRAGTDTISYVNSSLGVNVDLNVTIGQTSSGDAASDILSNFENLTGSGQGDVLSGTSGANVILGLGGNDTIEGRAGADIIDGGDGTDTANYANAGAAVTVDISVDGSTQTGSGDHAGDVLTSIENLIGSAFADTLIGNSGMNVLTGGDGNDTLEGLAGADTIAGGEGVDMVTYVRSSLAVTVDLTLASGQSGGDADGDLLSSIENLTGSNQADTLSGNSAANWILGGSGNDTIDGRAGADTLDGGDGIDTLTYVSSGLGVTVSLESSTAQGGVGDGNGDLLANFENLTGSAYGDTLTGNSGDNTVNGGGGNDVLFGGQGTDTLLGDLGNDTLDGGAGNDTLNGGEGSDTVDYSTSSGGVTVDLRLATPQGGGGAAAGDVLIDIENIIGSSSGDMLTGNESANTLNGGGGDDLLIGYGGADMLNGGDGIDRVSYASSGMGIFASLDGSAGIFGDASGDTISNVENLTGSSYDDVLGASLVVNQIEGGDGFFDLVSYANASAAVTVNLALSTQGGSSWENGDSYTNVEGVLGTAFADTLTGDGADNILDGNGGADTLNGAGGDDVLYGGFGDDVLIGGAGADEMYGESGTDTVSYAGGTARVVVDLRNMSGSEADATGDQYSGIERWIATSFDDQFYMGSSITHVDGGAGYDHVGYYDSNAAVTVNLSLTTAQGGGFASGDTLLSIESIQGSYNYGDTLIGSNANEWFYGLFGNDTLSGGGGNDWLRGDWGGDTIDGGSGYDTYAINEWSDDRDSVTVYVDGRTSVGEGAANGDTAINVERVYGGSANETVVASTGLQRFDGNGGVDTIDFRGSTQGVTVNLNLVGGDAQTSAGLASGFVLTGVESVLGTGFADTLTGDTGNNTIGGLGGADVLTGLGGNDTFLLTGSQLTGATPDLVRVDGGAGYDAIEISGLSAGQSVSLAHLLSTNGSGQQVGTSIEQVGIRDGLVQNVTISAADVQALVGAGDSSLLTLRVDNGDFVTVTDSYTTASVGGVTIYSDALKTQQIAQINYMTA